MSTAQARLLENLIARQRDLGLSDRKFARLMGLCRVTWQLTRNGHVPLGATVARGAQRAFPDLAPDAIALLLTGRSR